MKKFFILMAMVLFSVSAFAQEQTAVQIQQKTEVSVDDFQIVSDEVREGIRYIVATPCAKVCSKRIDIEIKDEIIMKVVYTRGCEGNAKGIGALIKGMSVDEAIRRLDGITCGKRGTSCPDQLSKVLKALK
jgi:uncharacterized protein (TIGR03905 family)